MADHLKFFDFLADTALRGSSEVRTHLGITEDTFCRLALIAQPNAKHYFLYSVLDDVYGIGVAILRWSELLGDDSTPDDDDASGEMDLAARVVSRAFSAEKALWIRRLVESLAHLICFISTNQDPFYRHFLLRHELRNRIFQIQDYQHFYECRSKNLEYGAKQTADAIRKLEAELDLTACWYLPNRSRLSTSPRPNQLLASFSSILKTAVKNAEPRERMLLGLSYQGFSHASQQIHFAPGHTRHSSAEGLLYQAVAHCGLLAHAVLYRVIQLLDIRPDGICGPLMKNYEKSDFPLLDPSLGGLVSGKASPGDFAVVGTALARVVKVNTSKYGYESYEISYLADPPIPSIESECVLPRQVRKLWSSAELKEKIIALLAATGGSMESDKIDDSLEVAVKKCWNLGLRDLLINR